MDCYQIGEIPRISNSVKLPHIILKMALPPRILIVGGGVFGCEYQQSLGTPSTSLHCHTTYLYQFPHRLTFPSIHRPLPVKATPRIQSNSSRVLTDNPQSSRLVRRHIPDRTSRLCQRSILQARRSGHPPLAQHRLGP